MEKRLMRSQTDKVIGGVCGGLGEYFDIDPVFVRVLTVLLAIGTGFGFIAYIVAMIIIPKKEIEFSQANDGTAIPKEQPKKEYSSWNRYLPGMILICIGLIILISENVYWFSWDEFWPLAIILVGIYLVFKRKGRTSENPSDPNYNVEQQQSKPENGGVV